uniref:Uncharacterized protein n=1 Tax=Anopheles gambiae TaxID=7165 RepID=A0A0E3W2B9_ANOGA
MCPECTVVMRGITVARCALASSSSSPSSGAPCTAVHRQRHHGRPCAAVPAERSKRARHHSRPLLSRSSTPQRPQHPESCLISIIGVRSNNNNTNSNTNNNNTDNNNTAAAATERASAAHRLPPVAARNAHPVER